MIYARALDQTVADDYFRAMEQVEQRLVFPVGQLKQPSSATSMLGLVDSLFKSRLDPEQSEIVSALRTGLSLLAGQQLRVFDVNVLVDT